MALSISNSPMTALNISGFFISLSWSASSAGHVNKFQPQLAPLLVRCPDRQVQI
jgi:hypothetical protein